MSNRRCLVDSNVWLYAFMQSESSKTIQAVEIISNPKVVLSTQVVNEICVNLIKKAHYSELEIQQTVKRIFIPIIR